MDLDLRGKVVLVTGGGRGIGAAIVAALANEGAVPVSIDRAGGDIAAELTDPESRRRAVESALATHGKIDALVNNAGVNDGVGLASGDPERFMESIRKNLTHYYAMAHYALPSLKAARGAIVNIVSKVAETGQGGTSAYAAANGGRAALTREWAVELAPFGVRANAVVVAECWTPMYEQWAKTFADPEAVRRRVAERVPLGRRMTEPAEIADAAAFLVSARASHVTGQMLHVDGGYVHLDRAMG